MLLDLIVVAGVASDDEKVELLAGNCVQTREIQKLNLDINLGAEATLPH